MSKQQGCTAQAEEKQPSKPLPGDPAMKVLFYLALLLALHLLNLPPANTGFLKVPMQRKTRTMQEYLNTAKQLQSSSKLYQSPVRVRNSDFFCEIKVGTPPQTFTVLLDTSATGIWIPSATCPTNVYDMCRNHRRYDRTRSITYVREGQMMGYGSMVAELSYDTVWIGGGNATMQSFAEVFQYKYNDSGIPYDGLMGMGLGLTFSNDKSIFTNMKEQKAIDEMVYGIYLTKNSTDPNDSGGLVIGGRNTSAFYGTLTYVPSMYDVMWQIAFKDVLLLLSPNMPKLCTYGCTAVPRTGGGHNIISDHTTISILHKHLGAVPYEDSNTYHFNCSALHTLQPVYFSLGDALIKVSWQSYVDRVIGPTGEIACFSAFLGSDDLSSDNHFPTGWYLGDVFYTSVYVEYDFENLQIGFAQSVYSYPD